MCYRVTPSPKNLVVVEILISSLIMYFWGGCMDNLGLVRSGDYLTVFIPATQSALVFRVRSRVNEGREVFNYGPLPIASGTSLPTYEGTSTTVPADGVLPARSYVRDGITFPALTGMETVFTKSDIWYLSEDDRDRLFHVKTYVYPPVIRADVQIPAKVTQGRFQKERVITGVDSELGFSRGFIEVVHIPLLDYGYRFGNDTNLNLKTFVKFIYGEYLVEVPRNPDLIFDILVRKVPSLWVTLPVAYVDPKISDALVRVYGFPSDRLGFKVYRADERDRAVREYSELLRLLKV
jgi:hypothetical protein